MAHAINPELDLRRFDGGVTPETIDDFLRDADLFVDGFDFFELGLRRQVFSRCAALGYSRGHGGADRHRCGLHRVSSQGHELRTIFPPRRPPQSEQHVRFLLGLTPRALHRRYLVDPTGVDLARRRGPSTMVACQLCAGVTAVAAVKLLLGRGDLLPAPYNHQFDPYRGRSTVTRLVFGNSGPLQRLKIAVGQRLYARLHSGPPLPEPPATPRSSIEEILNLARWAPSGDNAQPWTFRIVDARCSCVSGTSLAMCMSTGTGSLPGCLRETHSHRIRGITVLLAHRVALPCRSRDSHCLEQHSRRQPSRLPVPVLIHIARLVPDTHEHRVCIHYPEGPRLRVVPAGGPARQVQDPLDRRARRRGRLR